MIADIRDWCRGKSWLARLPVWLFLLYVGVRQHQNPQTWTVFTGINLCIHEGGHLLLRFAGEPLHVAGGTLLQLAAPIAAAVLLGRQRDYFGVVVGLGWLSSNLIEVGVYMADARARELPLVSVERGDGPVGHDWNYLFGYFHLLPYDETIGLGVRGCATIVMAAGLLFGAWLFFEMAQPGPKVPPPEEIEETRPPGRLRQYRY